jgi:4-cresol dehydrogenase (hydroxylating)
MAAQCGMEVVLANGDLMRTGMGAMPGNKSWNLYKRGLGPTPDQLFMQSNFGIVTKMGIWLMPNVECYMPMWLRVWKDDDLGPAVDTLRRLMLDRTIDHVPQLLNTVLMASLMTKRELWHTGEGPIPDPVLDKMGRELELGRWLMRSALYGDEAVVDYRFKKVKEAFDGSRRKVLFPGRSQASPRHPDPPCRDDARRPEVDRIQLPELGRRWRSHRLLAGVADDRSGRDQAVPHGQRPSARTRLRLHGPARDRLPRVAPRDGDRIRQDQPGRARAAGQAVQAARAGSRSGGVRRIPHAHPYMDTIGTYKWNDNALLKMHETIKDALDPKGILAPGKSGIWPKHLREGGKT